MMADLQLVAQADRPNAGRDIEAGVPLDAERLQRDRSIGAADQHIGAGAKVQRTAFDEPKTKPSRRDIAGQRADLNAALRIAPAHRSPRCRSPKPATQSP